QREPRVRTVRDVPEAGPRTGHVPVEHHGDATVAEERVPRRPIVMTDDLVGRRRNQSPSRSGGRLKTLDEVVVATEQTRTLGQMIVVDYPVRGRIRPARMSIAIYVLEYFAALFVHPSGAWRFEPGVLEEAKQRVDRRSP